MNFQVSKQNVAEKPQNSNARRSITVRQIAIIGIILMVILGMALTACFNQGNQEGEDDELVIELENAEFIRRPLCTLLSNATI